MTGLVTIGLSSIYLFYSTYLSSYPNENPFLALGIMLTPMLVSSIIWTMLSVAFPRSGGDYVFNSRVLHPTIGLMNDVMVVGAIPLGYPWIMIISLSIISDMFFMEGMITGNAALTSVGNLLLGTNFQFAFLTVFLIITVFFILGQTRAFFKAQTVLNFTWVFYIVLTAIALIAIGNGAYQGMFSSFFHVDYNGVITTANSQGFVTPNWGMPSLIGVSGLFFWLTIQWPSYVAGEMKTPQRSLVYAFVIAQVVAFALFFLFGVSMVTGYGKEFITATTYLINAGKNPLPTSGTMLFLNLGAPLIGNPVLIAVVYIVLACANYFSGTFQLLASSRKIFAWSFDRIIPAKFSEVSDRFKTPVYSAVLICVLTEIYVILSYYGPGIYAIVSGLGVIYTALFLGIAAFSALFLPFRKQIFEQVPPLVRKSIGKIPVISVLGAIGVVSILGILWFGQIMPAIQGGLNPGQAAWTFLTFLAGLPLYYFAKWYRRKYDNLDISLAFKVIPPE